ncbi:MAG: hypothetical protein U0271_35080 [Polyangiaceae bacterium]
MRLKPADSLATLILLTALAACSSSNGKADSPEGESSSTATASASTSPSASDTNHPDSKPVGVDTTPKANFVAVAEIPVDSTLFPIDGALVVAGQGTVPAGPDGESANPIGIVVDGKLEMRANALPGWWHNVVAIQGHYPDAVYMLANSDTGRAPLAEAYKLDLKKGWVSQKCAGCMSGNAFLGMFASPSGPIAVRAQGPIAMEGPAFLPMKGGKSTMKFAAPPSDCPKDQFPTSFVMIDAPLGITALADGTVMSFGTNCKGEAVLETWASGANTSAVSPLPIKLTDSTQIIAGKKGGAWLLGDSLSHFDGTSWSSQATPPNTKELRRAAVGDDDTLYVIADNNVFALAGGAWQRLPLSSDARPYDLAVDSAGVLWLLAGTGLYRYGEGQSDTMGGKVDATKATAMKKPTAIKPGGKSCKNNVVVLFTFSKVTPDDYDFPQTRKAVKGHTEFSSVRFVVTRDYGKKFFAAMSPDFDTANKLMAVVKKEIPTATPTVVCAEPEIVRELKLDLKTGDVVK